MANCGVNARLKSWVSRMRAVEAARGVLLVLLFAALIDSALAREDAETPTTTHYNSAGSSSSDSDSGTSNPQKTAASSTQGGTLVKVGADMLALASNDLDDELFSDIKSLASDLGKAMVGRRSARERGVRPLASGSAFAAVRKIWQGFVAVHSIVVYVLNMFNPCLPVGVFDCAELCPPCTHIASGFSRLDQALQKKGRQAFALTARAARWTQLHVPYLCRLSELEHQKRRHARLEKIEARTTKVRQEVSRQRVRLQQARETLDVVDAALDEAQHVARAELGSDTMSRI